MHELGAYWFLEKPIQPASLEVLIRRAGSHAGLRAEKRNLERQLSYKGSLGELVGTSVKMQEIFALLQQAGPSKACVLITGESGTGKEMVARTVHALSPRRQGPFVAINCAALPETLIESELFGHEKGSFTGASERRAGCFEVAQHGTLLLDEIGEMPMQTQAKLLRILEDSKVRRLGGKTEFEVDVRVVAATNKVPEEAVSGGHLREDLYYRLNVFHIHLPPLRERKDDIPPIAEALIGDLNRKHDCRVSEISSDRDGGARAAQVAGQCPRTAQRAGARGHSGGRRDHRDQTSAGVSAKPLDRGGRRGSFGGSGCGDPVRASGGWGDREIPDRHHRGGGREGL